MPLDDVPLAIDGLSLDAVCENFVRQVVCDTLDGNSAESLQDTVNRDKAKRKCERQIATLEKKVVNEKQFNRKVELNAEIKLLRKELREL